MTVAKKKLNKKAAKTAARLHEENSISLAIACFAGSTIVLLAVIAVL